MSVKGTKTYNSWRGLKERCENESHKDYIHYGGRNIRYPIKWIEYNGFLEDMGERPEGKELDRKDNNKDYSKENCRWVTHAENSRNTRQCKLTAEKVHLIKALIKAIRNNVKITTANVRIADVFKVDRSTIQAIRTGRSWYNIK